MHILFLTENFPPEGNASASRVFERARYWVQWGHQVTVLTTAPNFPNGKIYEGYQNRWRQVETIDGIRVVRVKSFIAANEGFLLRTADFLSFMLTSVVAGLFEEKPDVVVATSPQFFTAMGGCFLGALRRVPFVMEVGDLFSASVVAVGAMRRNSLVWFIEKLEMLVYRQSSAIVVLTDAFKADLIAHGVDAAKIAVVINGVDLPRYAPRPRNAELAKQFGVSDNFVVGYIGTHGMAHGLHSVLDAAEMLRTDVSIRFLFVGAGADKASLIEAAGKRNLTNVVFGPLQPKALVPEVWSLCDVALIHLKDDPVFETVIPSKIFEAMAMGLPLLAGIPNGEAAKIIESAQAGVVVPAEDPVALAEAVRELKDNVEARQNYAAHSLRAAPTYSREQQASNFIRVLGTVVPEKNP